MNIDLNRWRHSNLALDFPRYGQLHWLSIFLCVVQRCLIFQGFTMFLQFQCQHYMPDIFYLLVHIPCFCCPCGFHAKSCFVMFDLLSPANAITNSICMFLWLHFLRLFGCLSKVKYMLLIWYRATSSQDQCFKDLDWF